MNCLSREILRRQIAEPVVVYAALNLFEKGCQNVLQNVILNLQQQFMRICVSPNQYRKIKCSLSFLVFISLITKKVDYHFMWFLSYFYFPF
jgi:hypothetical protein